MNNNKNFTLRMPDFAQIPRALRHHPHINDNKEIVLELVQKNVDCFEYVSERLKNDADVAFVALGVHTNYLYFCGELLRNDKSFILTILESIGNTPGITIPDITLISEQLRDDKDVAIAFVSKNGYLLKNISQRLQKDYDVVLATLKNDITVFSSIDNLLFNDIDFFKMASKEVPVSLKYFGERVVNNRECVFSAIKNNWYDYKYVGYELSRDFEVAYAALESKKLAYQLFPYDLIKMIGDNDPMDYLSKAIMEKKLQGELNQAANTSKKTNHSIKTSLKAKI